MPLKVVSRPGRQFLYLRGTVRGKSVYESTETSDPGAAEGLRIKREKEIWDESVYGRQATATFAEAAASYLSHEPRSRKTASLVEKLLRHFRTRAISQIDQTSLEGAYIACLRNGTAASAANKVRSVITPLCAILEHAAIQKWCARPAFKKPGIAKSRIEIAYPAEVDALILGAADHLRPILTFLVGTGCRPSEAFELQRRNVDLRGATAVVQQKQGDFRSVSLCPRVITALRPLIAGDPEGPVFLTQPVIGFDGRVLAEGHAYRTGDDVGGQIKTAFATAARRAGWPGRWRVWTPKGAKTPKRQWVSDRSPYTLRHSAASWHYCVHRDLLKMMDEFGWGEAKTARGYTKLMPEAYRPDVVAWWAGEPIEVRKNG